MSERIACGACRDGEPLSFTFTMAFHPIVDVGKSSVWGYEALVRGTEGQSAFEILSQVTEANRYKFDQACRVRAIELAAELFSPDDGTRLSINFMPNAVYEPIACIRATLEAARRVRFDPRRLMFEFTENERVEAVHLRHIVQEYKRMGFTTAIDDFGAGFAGLSLLADFQPNVVKIDMVLVRGIDTSPARQAIIDGIMCIARALSLTVIAEGVETHAELATLRQAGIELFQGFLFGKPALERLPKAIGIGLTS